MKHLLALVIIVCATNGCWRRCSRAHYETVHVPLSFSQNMFGDQDAVNPPHDVVVLVCDEWKK